MKQSRHFPQPTINAPLSDKNHPTTNKSNISSLKAILSTFIPNIDQGRVPLAQYINEKAVKNDNNHQNLSYFEYLICKWSKLKAMFAKGEMKTVR